MYNKKMDKEKIIREYEKILEIPENKPKEKIMVCPIGIVGSGKTTVVKPLSESLSLLIISSDEIRKFLKKNGCGYDLAGEIAFDLAEKYIEKKYKIKIFWIHINPPEEFIINKLKNYKHTWLFRDADQAIENYKSSKANHQNINFPFIYTFDTSRNDLGEQIKEAISIIIES
ncbi:MAG: hypothetical protein HW401_280 [Parcubacteria group bacterium]|nr:hypothetical protein [Parcubacteria group bacterium]